MYADMALYGVHSVVLYGDTKCIVHNHTYLRTGITFDRNVNVQLHARQCPSRRVGVGNSHWKSNWGGAGRSQIFKVVVFGACCGATITHRKVRAAKILELANGNRQLPTQRTRMQISSGRHKKILKWSAFAWQMFRTRSGAEVRYVGIQGHLYAHCQGSGCSSWSHLPETFGPVKTKV